MRKILCVFMSIVFLLNSTSLVYAKTVKDLKKKQSQVKTQSNDTKKKLEQTKQEKKTAVSEMLETDVQLDSISDEVDTVNRELDKTNELYNKTKIELDEAVRLKDKQYDLFKKRVRFMYVRGKSGYVDIILESKDFSDMANRMEYVNRIVAYDQNLVTELKNTEQVISTKLAETAKQQEDMRILASQKKTKMANLERSLKQKERVVNSLDSDESKYNELLKDLNDADRNLASLIRQKQKQAEASRKKSGSKVVSAPYTGGKLKWPSAAKEISSPYGYRIHPISKKSQFHTGIDIRGPVGTPIYAATGGTVIFTGRKSGYGLTVVVDHGNGLSTLYAHCSKIIAKNGNSVKAGEQIAKIGSTGYSTGPHVHFEVRVNGVTTNPKNYLNK